MTYQELKEKIEQQGTQCGVNLGLSAATLVVNTEGHGYDETPRIVSAIAFAFGFSREDVDNDGKIYKDTFVKLCKLLMELKLKNELPRIELIYNSVDNAYIGAWAITDMLYNSSYSSISWTFEGDPMVTTVDNFDTRPSL